MRLRPSQSSQASQCLLLNNLCFPSNLQDEPHGSGNSDFQSEGHPYQGKASRKDSGRKGLNVL